MAYLVVENLRFGMDRRRKRVSGVPGTLWTLKNGIISRGGDAVRAKKFVSKYTLPANTHGLCAVKGQLYVFGSIAAPTMPASVQYQRLQGVGAEAMVRVLDAKPFDGLVYAVAEFDDGSIYHYYDGTRVSSWDTIADAASSYKAVAERLAGKINGNSAVTAEVAGAVIYLTAKTAGTAFTLATATTDGGGVTSPTAVDAAVTANVAAVAEVRATGTVTVTGGSLGTGNEITSLTVNGVELLAAPVRWVLSNDSTANSLANAILSNTSASGYTASAAGGVVTIRAATGTGTTPNGYVVAATVSGSVTVTTADMAGGVAAVTAVAQVSKVTIAGGSFDAADTWTITVNGTDYKSTGRAAGMGTSVFVFKGRIYSTAGSLVRYCVLDDATDWATTTTPEDDAGNINISTDTEGPQQLVAMAHYNGAAAVFADEAVPVYSLNADATTNQISDTVTNTGLLAARAAVPFGNTDLFYLDQSGVRSLRSREGYDAAFVGDVGSAIDEFVQGLIAAATGDMVARAVGVIEPLDGRYMLALGSYILVLSYFPSSKITAWSYLDPGFSVTDLVRARRRLYARAGDTIYLYGGDANATYPDDTELPMTLEFPFMAANDPAGLKNLTAFDMAGENDWEVDILVDPNDETAIVQAGVVNRITYNGGEITIPGQCSHFALNMTCSRAGDASVSSLAIHYNKE